jgi:hypothetical protein
MITVKQMYKYNIVHDGINGLYVCGEIKIRLESSHCSAQLILRIVAWYKMKMS